MGKYEGEGKFSVNEEEDRDNVDESDEENYNIDEDDFRNWDEENSFKLNDMEQEEKEEKEREDFGERRRLSRYATKRMKKGMTTARQGLARAGRTAGARYSKRMRYADDKLKKYKSLEKQMKCLVPKTEALKLEKIMGKISNIAQGPWMLPTNEVFERRLMRILETYDLHSAFTFPGVPTDAPPDWTLNVDHLGEFLKSGTASVDMIIKLLQEMEIKFSVPSCCKPVPKRIKQILIRMKKTSWQTFDAWRVNKGRTS